MNKHLFEYFMPQSALDALSNALGHSFTGILAPFLSLEETSILTTSISIPLAEKLYLVIENDWGDTAIDFLDYYKMNAYMSDLPKDIAVDDQTHDIRTHKFPVSSVSVGANEPIIAVEVYAEKEEGDTEVVNYDKALILRRKDGKEIAFMAYESISGEIEIIREKETIEGIRTGYSLRYSKKADEKEEEAPPRGRE